MNNREKKMVYALSALFVGGLFVAAYMLVYVPIEDSYAEVDRLETEMSKREPVLNKQGADAKRVEAAKKRSLPADEDTARVQYNAMLSKLLARAGVPPGFTVNPQAALDDRTSPVLDAKTKKPAYKKIGFKIHMEKVEVGTLTAFLQSYYKLNLLQRITQFDISRKDQDVTGTKARNERSDLTVDITTEAIILDGAENRRTLLPISIAAAGIGGQAGYFALLNSPEAGRGVTPLQYVDVLAKMTPPRDYQTIVAKNYFHGLLPVPPELNVEIVKVAPPPPPARKEDISGYIKLTSVTREPSVGAEIWDKANNQLYVIELKPKGERYDISVEKFYYLNSAKKRLDKWAELVIAEEGTSTNRTFKVIGIDHDGIVLTEAVMAGVSAVTSEAPKTATSRRTPGGSHEKPVDFGPPSPVATITGGAVAATSPIGERVFVWRVGQSLKSLEALTPEEAQSAIQRAYPRPPNAQVIAPTAARAN